MNTPTTPIEELRAAAARLRETAKGTTPGPWYTADCEISPRWMLTMGKTDARGYAEDVVKSYSGDDFEVSDADWAWMAFAHPGLAEPLAALLEDAARQAACHQQTPGYVGLPDYRLCHDCQEEECYGLQALDKALAVARVILGGGEKPGATTKDGAW